MGDEVDGGLEDDEDDEGADGMAEKHGGEGAEDDGQVQDDNPLIRLEKQGIEGGGAVFALFDEIRIVGHAVADEKGLVILRSDVGRFGRENKEIRNLFSVMVKYSTTFNF